jgi:hypothetical protein
MKVIVLSVLLFSGCTSMSVQFTKEEKIFQCKGECEKGLRASNKILEQQVYASILQSMIK